jgi:hypothetical protein
VIFDCKKQEKVKNENCFKLNKNNVKKIESSISESNNILLCILFNYQSYNSYCYINNWNNDLYLIQCTYNSCEDIKVFYYMETKQFSFVCKQSEKFITYYINDTNNINYFKCNKKETILINCDYNQKYNDSFSLIYNDTINYYNIITDYNFTKSKQICSFNYPEKKIPIILNTTNGTNITNIIYPEEEEEQSEFIRFPDFFNEEEIIENSIKESIKNYSNEENNENENIEISPEYILNNKNEIIKQINIGENHDLETKDFKLSIRPTNSTPPKNSTYIEFEECEQLLRKINNISNSSLITFFQIEMKNTDPTALINQVKYSAYDENQEELDLSLCEDIDT